MSIRSELFTKHRGLSVWTIFVLFWLFLIGLNVYLLYPIKHEYYTERGRVAGVIEQLDENSMILNIENQPLHLSSHPQLKKHYLNISNQTAVHLQTFRLENSIVRYVSSPSLVDTTYLKLGQSVYVHYDKDSSTALQVEIGTPILPF